MAMTTTSVAAAASGPAANLHLLSPLARDSSCSCWAAGSYIGAYHQLAEDLGVATASQPDAPAPAEAKRKKRRRAGRNFTHGGRTFTLMQQPRGLHTLPQTPAGPPPARLRADALYAQHGAAVERELERRRDFRASALAAASGGRAAGDGLLECSCCYGDGFLPALDMVNCHDGGHLFCRECVRRHVHELFGRGAASAVRFGCLEQAGCTSTFGPAALEACVGKIAIEGHESRLQQAELRRAGLVDLAECPFCNFAVIMPDPADRVLQCLGPACGKRSCRLCLKLDHSPLHCDEVEGDAETAARKAVEDKMTAALTIACRKCKAKFFKTDGCNHMTCPCGAHYCYQCREPISRTNPYAHFKSEEVARREGGCVMYMNTVAHNARQVREAGEAALEEADMELKRDPTAGRPAPRRRRRRAQGKANQAL